MNATPETFKPGERWLCAFERYGALAIREVECVRWSDSGKYLKVRLFHWDSESGKQLAEVNWTSDAPELLERLPDVEIESGNNQTKSEGGVEVHCGIRVYDGGRRALENDMVLWRSRIEEAGVLKKEERLKG